MPKCLMCGTEFVPSKFQSGLQIYCSKKCRLKAYRFIFKNERYAWNRAYAKKKARQDWHTKNCKECGIEFLPRLGNKNQQLFCTIKCREKYWRKWEHKTEYAKAKKRFDVSERRMRVRANGGRFSPKEWEEMKEKYSYACNFCGKQEPEIKLVKDHIFPIIRGGKHCKENIQPLCISCNCKKHDKIDSVPCIRHTGIEKPTLKMSVVGTS